MPNAGCGAAAQRGRVALLQGRAEALPLPAGSVDAVVLTFPTEYAYAAATWQEFARVLIPGGQVIWIDAGELRDPGWLVRTLQTLLPGAELASLMDGIIPGSTSRLHRRVAGGRTAPQPGTRAAGTFGWQYLTRG
ncbi:MAG: methyltransferase domain-containing protein [Anaerolineae bacterium]|nr:MAG: methyltransferase domain-containing protein [Anaerolineae bacterium]